MSKGRLLAMLAVLGGVAAFALMALYGLKNDPQELPSALLGKPFPAFAQPALGEPDKLLTEKDLLGKPALVNVWATWCPTWRRRGCRNSKTPMCSILATPKAVWVWSWAYMARQKPSSLMLRA